MADFSKRTILLTGVTGQVGGQLLRTLADFGEIVAPSRAELDLAQPESVGELIRTLRPRWIVNPGAYTAVDKAESEPDLAFAVNEATVATIGKEAQKIGAAVIHFSTDYVFAGLGTKPYVETDVTGPTSVYGASKLAGEQALATSGAAHLIFRTSWVYGATGKNFLLTIRKVACERENLRIVADQYGAPTWSRDLAEMTASVIAQCEATTAREGKPLAETVKAVGGIYHAAGTGETTWHGFAAEAVQQMREKNPAVRLATIEGISTAEYPTPAKRPANSRLECSKLERTFRWRMPDWQQSLQRVTDELDRSSD
jgi:dTDP-4-dehydrorhamnose reductase